MRFGTCNDRSLYRAGSLTAAARELARYKLHLAGVQEGRWDKRGTLRAGDYNCFYGNGYENHELGTGFFLYTTRESRGSGMLSYIVLRDRWCNIVLNMRAPSEEKRYDAKDNFYGELEQVF